MPALVKPYLHGGEHLGINDPQLRHGLHLPAGFRVDPRDALAGLGISCAL
jgi:hypothetical protein